MANESIPGWVADVRSTDPTATKHLTKRLVDLNVPDSLIIVSREAENWGAEAVPYLHFIVDHYHSLPPHTAFVHGNPTAHTPFLGDMLACLNHRFDGYFALGETFVSRRRIQEDGLYERYDPLYRGFEDRLAAIGLANMAPQRVEILDFYASVQFIVSCAAIQQRPLAYWQTLLETVTGVRDVWNRNEKAWKNSAYWLEVLWHEIFSNMQQGVWRSANMTCGIETSTTIPLLATFCGSHIGFDAYSTTLSMLSTHLHRKNCSHHHERRRGKGDGITAERS